MPPSLFRNILDNLRGTNAGADCSEAVGENDGAGKPEADGKTLAQELLEYGIDPFPGESELGKRQELFAFLVAKLLHTAYEMGFKVRLGETLRTDEQQEIYLRTGFSRASRSLHQDKLAIDLNLMKGSRLVTQSEEHLPLGEWWERLHPLCRWGGRFNDGNHYSIAYGGRK